MKILKRIVAAILLVSAFAFHFFQSTGWKIKTNYSVKCTEGIEASFTGLKATILFDELHPERSKIAATIDARTINTGNSLKSSHARSALDTDKYPIIMFTSTSIKKTDKGYEATGNLTLKGVTKEIKIPFIFEKEKTTVRSSGSIPKETFFGTITIIPEEFNVTRTGTPDKVLVELTVPVTK